MRIEEIILSPYDEGIEFCVIGKAKELIPFADEVAKKIRSFNNLDKEHYITDLDFIIDAGPRQDFPNDGWLTGIIGKDISKPAYDYIRHMFIVPLIASAWTINKPTGYFKLFMEEELK